MIDHNGTDLPAPPRASPDPAAEAPRWVPSDSQLRALADFLLSAARRRREQVRGTQPPGTRRPTAKKAK
jgi:hypothetical protein